MEIEVNNISKINYDDLLFAKVRPDAAIPQKDEENAGYDIYACFDEEDIVICPGITKLIPTGIASALHSSKYIQLEERGSTGSRGIKRSAGVIDSGYRGEWFVAITNCSNKTLVISKLSKDEYFGNTTGTLSEGLKSRLDNSYIIYPYEKAIAQAIVHDVPKMNIKEVSLEELQSYESDRGSGKLGSSGK